LIRSLLRRQKLTRVSFSNRYSELLEEWLTGHPRGHERGKWEDDYTALHAEVSLLGSDTASLLVPDSSTPLQILNGQREPMLLEYVCPNAKLCGGLGDR
jgi:hypothetical protein